MKEIVYSLMDWDNSPTKLHCLKRSRNFFEKPLIYEFRKVIERRVYESRQDTERQKRSLQHKLKDNIISHLNSPMAAIIRVKRRIDEEPQNAFVLNCKKRKTDDITNNPQHSSLLNSETKTILKFAGTVDSQDVSITSHMSKLTKEEAKSISTKKRVPANTTARCREETKQSSQENRFKIVNCYRALDENNGEESKNITVVDVESNQPAKEDSAAQTSTTSCSSSGTSSAQNDGQQSSQNFVYDLYLPDTNEMTEMGTNLVNDLLSVHPLTDDLYYGRCPENGYIDSDCDIQSDDSNSESNWRNDYPDEDNDDNESILEEEMRRAVNDMNIEDGLSDADYSDVEEYTDNDEYSEDELNIHGRAFARYRKRVSNENDDCADDDEDDEASDEAGDYESKNRFMD